MAHRGTCDHTIARALVTAHGFNLGLLGQATLAREIIAAAGRNRDIGAPDLLARYGRAHRRATLPLYLATNALVKLYTAETLPLRLARHALLRLANRMNFRKTAEIRREWHKRFTL